MSKDRGLRRQFPKHRRTVLEIIQAARTVPAFPLETTMSVALIEAARKAAAVRISWTAIFIKAYALVCEQNEALREVFVTYPFAYFYRHPTSMCSVSVHRKDDQGIERLVWGRIADAETSPITEVQQQLNECSTLPLNVVYRDGLRLERSWWIARKFAWWWIMRWGGRCKARLVGTFSISSLGGQGCLNSFHPLITTSSIAFGPIDSDHRMRVVLLCDHRTIDGMLGAIALKSLSHALQTQILQELQSLASCTQAA